MPGGIEEVVNWTWVELSTTEARAMPPVNAAAAMINLRRCGEP
jgi:hypothetical protein